MKCISCEANIDPKWKFAIEQNTCPLCGQLIMSEGLKGLLVSLREVMEQLQEYPDQLDDWLLSNYNYIKTDSANLINYLPKDSLKEIKKIEADKEFQEKKDKKFTVKVKTEAGEQEVEAEKIQSEEKTNEFFRRAEAVKPNIEGFQNTVEKTSHLKKLAQQIKRAGAPVITSEVGDNSIIPAEMIESADPDAIAEMHALLSGNEVSSSLNDISNVDDEIPSVVLNMAQRARGGGKHANSADLIKLQQMQSRVHESRRNFEEGGARGKGGFSRS